MARFLNLFFTMFIIVIFEHYHMLLEQQSDTYLLIRYNLSQKKLTGNKKCI